MAEVVWTGTALQELETIAEYIALYNVAAANNLVQVVFDKTELREISDIRPNPT